MQPNRPTLQPEEVAKKNIKSDDLKKNRKKKNELENI